MKTLGVSMVRSALLFAVAAAAFSPGVGHAQMDMNAMIYWGEAKVIRWNVVGLYEGEDVVLSESTGAIAPVTDRVEITFDTTSAGNGGLTGTPGFTNSPSTMRPIRSVVQGCEAPSVSGHYEHATIESIENGYGGQLMMTVRTDYPPGDAPVMCSGRTQPVVAKSATEQEDLVIPPIMVLAMGDDMASEEMQASQDRKSIIVKRRGWTYTYTPTKVK